MSSICYTATYVPTTKHPLNPKSTYMVWVNNNKCSRTLLPKFVSVGLNMDKVLRVEEEGLNRLRIKCVGVSGRWDLCLVLVVVLENR